MELGITEEWCCTELVKSREMVGVQENNWDSVPHWAGKAELKLLAYFLNRTIVVVDQSGRTTTAGGAIIMAYRPGMLAEPEVRDSRMLLADLTAKTLKQGLDLLGIEVVEQM